MFKVLQTIAEVPTNILVQFGSTVLTASQSNKSFHVRIISKMSL